MQISASCASYMWSWEIDIVRRHQRQTHGIGQIEPDRPRTRLGGPSAAVLAGMALQFDIEPFAEGRRQPVGQRLGLGHLALRDQQAQGTRRAPGQADQPLRPWRTARRPSHAAAPRPRADRGSGHSANRFIHPAWFCARRTTARCLRHQGHLTADNGWMPLSRAFTLNSSAANMLFVVGSARPRHAPSKARLGNLPTGMAPSSNECSNVCEDG